jgi:hypothetical protein
LAALVRLVLLVALLRSNIVMALFDGHGQKDQ